MMNESDAARRPIPIYILWILSPGNDLCRMLLLLASIAEREISLFIDTVMIDISTSDHEMKFTAHSYFYIPSGERGESQFIFYLFSMTTLLDSTA